MAVAALGNDDRPTLEEIARDIAGKLPPSWLVEGLRACAAGVNQGRIWDKAATMQPAELRQALVKMGKAAGALRKALVKVEIVEQLEHAEGVWFWGWPSVNQLHEVEQRAEQAASKFTFAEPVLTKRAMYALAITEAWRAYHGEAPGTQSKVALTAADHFWSATGAPSLDRKDHDGDDEKKYEPHQRWRRAFEEAEKAPPDLVEAFQKLFRRARL